MTGPEMLASSWPQLRAQATVFRIPLRMRFRGVDVREGVLLRGPAGWAEFAPFWDYDERPCVPWLRAALGSALTPWPEPRRATIGVNAIVPAVGPDRAQELVHAAGATTVKVKVGEPGQQVQADLDRLRAVREALGPGGRIRCDANARWTLDEAAELLPRLDSAAGALEYVEQPVQAIEDLVSLRKRVAVPIAADESIRLAADPLEVARRGGADVAILKVPPLGGVPAVVELAARFAEFGIPSVLSSALDTSIGLAAGAAAAATLAELPFACGLGTGSLLAADVTSAPLRPRGGEMPVLRCAPDPDLSDDVAADEATTGRWLARLDSVAALMGLR